MNLAEFIRNFGKSLTVVETKRIDNIRQSEHKLYCKTASNCIRSRYIRTLSDLLIENNEDKLLLIIRKFCGLNLNYNHKTFEQRYYFMELRSVPTNK